MRIRQQQLIKQIQKLSPLQIQRIKLLELPTLQLEERIKQEVDENPVLENDTSTEEGEEKKAISVEEYLDQHEVPAYKYYNNYPKSGYASPVNNLDAEKSIQDHLVQQLSFKEMTLTELTIAEYLIGSLDDDGYLRREIEAISDDIAFSLGMEVSPQQIEDVLKIIQSLEPVGIGSRNVRECLLTQLDAIPNRNEAQNTAYKIIETYFNEFSRRHLEKIITRLDITEELFREAIEEIRKLSPKPGHLYNENRDQELPYIIPDFILERHGGEHSELSLASANIPDLKINKQYVNMLLRSNLDNGGGGEKQNQEAVQFVKEKIDSAKWFITSVRKRQETLLKTMNAIFNYQEEYFQNGDITKLRPMILKDIAEATELDISTVSRAVSNKYIQTPFGIIPLKQLFSEAIMTDSGEEVSSMEIKDIIQQAVREENKQSPFNDEQLLELLVSKGYRITRRTVAKYREMLGIDVARLRRSI